MLDMMSKNWWMWIMRGIFAVLFGVLAIILPNVTLTLLIWMFGAYVLADGVFNAYTSMMERESNTNWWFGLVEGLVSIIAGLAAFIWPGMTSLILLYVIAFWAIATGLMEIMAAIQLRKQIHNEVWLGLSGALSILFGVVMMILPGSGALALVWMIGIYAIVFGGMMIGFGLRVRNAPESVTVNKYDEPFHDGIRETT